MQRKKMKLNESEISSFFKGIIMSTVPLNYYLILSVVLFFIGVIGVLTRRNALIVLMSVELMLNAANLVFITFSRFRGDETGHSIVFFVIAIAAAEAAVGLAIVIALFRMKKSVNVDETTLLKH